VAARERARAKAKAKARGKVRGKAKEAGDTGMPHTGPSFSFSFISKKEKKGKRNNHLIKYKMCCPVLSALCMWHVEHRGFLLSKVQSAERRDRAVVFVFGL
jgi:hypothetical protein